ncbi:MAG: phosphatidylserine decarboxylase family protein [Muribaculum sp.]|nr:phosphatidylserine decarboxylase family protein [Muribaculaceae bacterium]MCM1080277.1 phosphatidylserine decarboxylase family protein [Muribaculum sp.]
MKVKIHREGLNILIILMFILLVINVPAWLFIRPVEIPVVFSALSAVMYLLVLNFFRSPKRMFVGKHTAETVVASADGKVVALEETFEDEYLHCRCIQLSIFMSIVNVHANWYPVDGKVLYVRHHNGRFLSAYLPKASTDNERSTVVIKSHSGQLVLMRQIAGAVARRIVTYATEGDEAAIDDHMGFIKFGSRVDLYLPLGTEILVKLGDHTTGGVTEVARLEPVADK